MEYVFQTAAAPRPACGSAAGFDEGFLIKLFPKEFIGLGGNRTRDPLHAMQARYCYAKSEMERYGTFTRIVEFSVGSITTYVPYGVKTVPLPL